MAQAMIGMQVVRKSLIICLALQQAQCRPCAADHRPPDALRGWQQRPIQFTNTSSKIPRLLIHLQGQEAMQVLVLLDHGFWHQRLVRSVQRPKCHNLLSRGDPRHQVVIRIFIHIERNNKQINLLTSPRPSTITCCININSK